jgi:hypothetical protein
MFWILLEKQFLLALETEKKIYNGDFVRAVLKIMNVVDEITNCCEYTNDLNIVEKLKPVAQMLLKYIVNNQSLYV